MKYYKFLASVCLIASIFMFAVFFVSNEHERNRFVNFNRSTVPDDDLEQVKSPTAITLSFNKFYHLDSIQWHDEYGNQVMNISTIFYKLEDKKDYSDVSADNYWFMSPYHWPLDEKQYSIIRVMEILSNCSFDSYQKSQAPANVTLFDYLDHGLPQVFNENVFKPLLRYIFDNTLYIRTSSSESIIKAIRLNQVGTISSVHLYNGEILYFENPLTSSSQKEYESLFHASLDEKAKEDLANRYNYRLSLRSLRDYSQEAENLANKHIKEISNSLLKEKIELLGEEDYKTASGQVKIREEYKKTTYPKWLDWLLGLSFFMFIVFIIFSYISYNKRKLYTHLQNRLNDVQRKFPNASSKHELPAVLNNKQEIEELLNRNDSIWIEEEQEIIRQQKQEQIIASKISELKNLYPNGWNKTKKNHPSYSDTEMISIENEIVSEEKDFQQAKEAARLAELNRIKKEKEVIKNELQSLTQATQIGNIELAEEKIKVLSEAAKSLTVDIELAKSIDAAKKNYNQKYKEGISETFDISYVDYTFPSHFVQEDNWSYSVAKFPYKGTFVFPYRRRKIARRGYQENMFQTYLVDKLSKFKLLILGDCAILPADNCRPYEPDIAIVDIERPSIRIDIEIDEPYSAIANKPIHYIGCGDDFRDMNLNNLGWIVVRFTEYQVKSDVQSCTSFIAQIIHSLNPSKPIPMSLLTQNFPQVQKRWTKIEAKVMASEKVREKYLNHEFGIVDSEQIEIADIKQTEKEKSCAKLVKPLIVNSRCQVARTTVDESLVFDRDNHIQFFPQEHIFLYNGQEPFIPVSCVISCFFIPFDSYYWSNFKANQRHVPQGQVLEEWDAKGACSRDVGTFMHQQIENYYKGLSYQQDFSFRYKGKYVHIDEQITLELEYMQFMEFLRNHKFKPFRTEWAIYDEDLKIAGTIDMIHEHGDIFDIYDWKRSHRIVDCWGEPITINSYEEKGLGELNQIDDTPYWHYCIQQNLYRYILEKNYNIKVGKMYLVVFCDDTNEYRKLDVPRMDETIVSIVKACQNGTVKKRLISLRGENLP